MRVRIGEADCCRKNAGRGENALGEACGESGVTAGGDVEDFEFGAGGDTLGVGCAGERAALSCGGIGLHQQNSLGDLLDIGRLLTRIAICLVGRHPE